MKKLRILLIAGALFATSGAKAQTNLEPYTFTTLPGPKYTLGAGGTGSAARAAVDSEGNVYILDHYGVNKITPSGTVTLLAEKNDKEPGRGGHFNNPKGVAVDSAGNVYVADASANTIDKIDPAGVVTILAGQNEKSGSADGIGANALFDSPRGVAADRAGNVYVSDTDNCTIRKITSDGIVTTIAGAPGRPPAADGKYDSTLDGKGSAARFNSPGGIAVDAHSNVFVAEVESSLIRKVTPNGVATTIAGKADKNGSADGTGSAARFNKPEALALDNAGNIYVADTGNDTIRKITPAGVVTTLGGSARLRGKTDGTGGAARFHRPQGIAVDKTGKVLVADVENDVVRVGVPAAVTKAITPAPQKTTAPASPGASPQVTAQGHILLSVIRQNTVAEYTTSGKLENASLISGIQGAGSIAVSGHKVFVLDIYDGSVGEYTTSGKTVNAKLIKDLETPEAMALTPDGKKIFVVCRAKGPGYFTRDNEGKMVIRHKLAMLTVYSTSGEVLEPWLVVVPGWEIPDSIAIAGDFVYVANSMDGTIGKYTTAGKVVKDPLIAGLSSPSALAVSGDNIFVTDSENDTIGQYTVSGETVNPALVSGLEYPSAIAIAGDNIFVVTGRPRTIGVYTRSGATVNASLIPGIDGAGGTIAIIP